MVTVVTDPRSVCAPRVSANSLRMGNLWLLLACLAMSGLGCSGGASAPSEAAEEAAEEAGNPPADPATPNPPGSPPAGPGAAPAAPAKASAPVAFKKPAPEPPELTVIRLRVIRGDRSVHTIKELQKLAYKYPKNADVAYILGQLYCTKLWISDCLQHFTRTLAIDPSYRDNSFLIRSVVAGLGNDSDHFKVRRFLVQQIGQPAQPYLEEVLQGTWRQQVKDRASATLREIK